ncbi:cytochrome c biogenesis CcdA family protein [Microbacterium sp. KRD172]|uniref:cytochrome c biogenesis CcdA family protein n=1 Tax=Microbacterium sp. KRD172 TaxID=2729727 RepID=UPI0019CFC7E8|nr:cytochrome c biogenesis CcdA family protein [Microbacterium sp. KRD172]
MDIGYAGAFFGGILTLLSPCSVMLLPAFFAYAFSSPTRLFARTAVFYLGLIATLVPIGALAGSFGALFTQDRDLFVAIASTVIIALGLVQLSGVRLPSFSRGGGGEGTSKVSVFVLGTVYGVAGVCAGPILGSVLTVAAIGGDAVYGGMLLAVYALGMVVPLVVLALVWDRAKISQQKWLRPRSLRIGRWQNSWLMIVSGALSIGIGILLLVTDGTAGLGGILTISGQFAAESWALNVSSGVSNLVFSIIAVLAISVVVTLYGIRSRRRRRRAQVAEDERVL